MSRVFFTSDWHLGHRGIIRYRPQFTSEEAHSRLIISRYMETVGSRDTVWFLGDICYTNESIELIRSLPGNKKIVLGNHDLQAGNSWEDYLSLFTQIGGLVAYKEALLSHAPIHVDELRGKINIHGHTHQHVISDHRYINVCLEQTDYYPISHEDLMRWASEEGRS